MVGSGWMQCSGNSGPRGVWALVAASTLVLGFVAPAEPAGVAQEELPSIERKTEGMRRLDGFFDLYWDQATGRLFWEIDRWDTEFLYQVSLSTGLGSNPVGLDRGQLGGTHILIARRVGPRVLLVEPNYKYRARSDYRDEEDVSTPLFVRRR